MNSKLAIYLPVFYTLCSASLAFGFLFVQSAHLGFYLLTAAFLVICFFVIHMHNSVYTPLPNEVSFLPCIPVLIICLSAFGNTSVPITQLQGVELSQPFQVQALESRGFVLDDKASSTENGEFVFKDSTQPQLTLSVNVFEGLVYQVRAKFDVGESTSRMHSAVKDSMTERYGHKSSYLAGVDRYDGANAITYHAAWHSKLIITITNIPATEKKVLLAYRKSNEAFIEKLGDTLGF